MVRPLTRCKKNGVFYKRPAAIEQSIAQALSATPATLPARVAISDPRQTEYLAPEVLVHLIRHALRSNNDSLASALLARLGARCARLLKRRVPDTNAYDAHDIREEVLSQLYELFADDVAHPDKAPLDFYEVRFNMAFATLRAGIIREALRQQKRSVPVSVPVGTDEETDDDGGELLDPKDPSESADVVLTVEKEQLSRLIQALPPDEREAIVWKYYFDLKTESNDPTEATVAKRCGVSGSEVRSRLRAAHARLGMWMEGKS